MSLDKCILENSLGNILGMKSETSILSSGMCLRTPKVNILILCLSYEHVLCAVVYLSKCSQSDIRIFHNCIVALIISLLAC